MMSSTKFITVTCSVVGISILLFNCISIYTELRINRLWRVFTGAGLWTTCFHILNAMPNEVRGMMDGVSLPRYYTNRPVYFTKSSRVNLIQFFKINKTWTRKPRQCLRTVCIFRKSHRHNLTSKIHWYLK